MIALRPTHFYPASSPVRVDADFGGVTRGDTLSLGAAMYEIGAYAQGAAKNLPAGGTPEESGVRRGNCDTR